MFRKRFSQALDTLLNVNRTKKQHFGGFRNGKISKQVEVIWGMISNNKKYVKKSKKYIHSIYYKILRPSSCFVSAQELSAHHSLFHWATNKRVNKCDLILIIFSSKLQLQRNRKGQNRHFLQMLQSRCNCLFLPLRK